MSGWDKSSDYGSRGGLLSNALALAVVVTLGLALVNCTPRDEAPAAEAPAERAEAETTGGNGDPCTAPLPTGGAGVEFAGVVRHVIDGDSLCVGPADGDGATWIEVRLMDFDAPEARQQGGPEAERALAEIAMGHEAQCVVTHGRSGATRSYDRVHAVCRVGGQTLGDRMRAAGIVEGGN